MSLNPRQERFVREYLIDLNATQAAIRAGYSVRTAEQQGPRLLGNVEVADAIGLAQGKALEKIEITAERVLRELGYMAFYDPGDIARTPMEGPQDIALLPEQVRRAIVGWGWDKNGNFTLKLSPKTPSLIEIGKHLGIAQRHELTGKDGEPLMPAHDLSKLTPEQLLQLKDIQSALVAPDGDRDRPGAGEERA